MKRILIGLALAGIVLASCEKGPVTPLEEVKRMEFSAEFLRPYFKELYDSTGGPLWITQPNWMEEDFVRDWDIVKINDDFDLGLEVDLSGNGLKGTLPENFFDLHLSTVHLDNNFLSGELPENLGGNGCLSSFTAVNNDLSGTIPVALSKSLLNELDLRDNRFSGEIPEEVKAMSFFRSFDLNPQKEGSGFHLPEKIVPDAEDVRKLHAFYEAQKPEVQAMLEWSSSDPLEWRGTCFDGNGRLRGLELFDIDRPVDFSKLNEFTSLKQLCLINTIVEDPMNLDQLTQLEYLIISGAELLRMPSGLESLKNLRYLDLSRNFIRGEIPGFLNGLTNLEIIDLSDNLFYGKIPVFDGFRKLRILALCDLEHLDSEPLPEWLVNFKNLSCIYMWGSNFTGSLPASWKKMNNLLCFDVGENLLTGNVQHYFDDGTLPLLEYVCLGNNYFSGPLPEFTEKNHLTALGLYRNNFTGEIPESWKNLTLCSDLSLEDNLLTGTIPEWFADLTELEEFYVEGNMMAGTLSTALLDNPNCLEWYFENQKNGSLTFPEGTFLNLKTAERAVHDIHEAKKQEYKAALKAEMLSQNR